MIANLKPYPKRKDPSVPWLEEVPAHWEVRRLGQIGRLSKGSGGNKEDEVPAGVPCVRYGDLYTTHTYFILQSRSFVSPEKARKYTPIEFGDVLFAASGETVAEIGKSAVNLMEREACCGGDVIVFRPKRHVDPWFMGYVSDCHPVAAQKATMGRGITVKHVYADELQGLALPLPRLPEQAAIVRFLDYVDRRIQRFIRAKQKLIRLLEEQKQAIIHRAVTRGLDPDVRLKPSGVEWLGEVPEHWEITRLARLIDLLTGYPFKSSGFTQDDHDVRLLRGVNVSPSGIRWNDIARWPRQVCETFSAFELHPGDIVLGMDRPIIRTGTRVAVVEESDVPSLLLQRVARLRPRDGLRADFLTFLLSGKSFADYLRPIFTGISVPHLSPDQVRSFRFALPRLEEQGRIVEECCTRTSAADAAIEVASREISFLREYRTRLIADVVTGKLDVREAAARLPDEPEEAEPFDASDDLAEPEEESEEDLEAVLEEAEA